ncbi:hypothetical protein O181_038998 [Austropuccinia psidii MF-1]|uniref:Tet-like 2OG-Fe(II) oxygenase domain-containing protein n=1 Tax=Austropuccinia psidii MF-1 TaxID=1389203 RepID=A0A9Q3HBJ3_9BASI|nr:hypothetical protein [Austropuccinia psidii MF-1]
MKESAKPPDNLSNSEHSFFKMVQSLIYPANPVKHFWENVMFESISLVSYDVIAPKPYVALTSNSTDPIGLKQGAAEYLASCLSKSEQHETQLSIEGSGADNEISTKPHKNLEDLMDTVIHLMNAYNMVCAHTKVKINGIKDKLTSSKKNEAIKDLLKCHKSFGINQIFYGILAAFCAAGVCGLMVCSDDWRTSSVKGALSLIDISKKLSEGKNLVELERSVKGNLRESVGVRKERVSGLLFVSLYKKIYIYASAFMWHPHWAPWKNIGFSRFRSSQCHGGSNREVKGCVPNKASWALAPFWTQNSLTSNCRKQYLISCLLQHKVIPQPLGNSGTSQKKNEARIAQKNRLIIALVECRPFTTMSEVEVNQWDELSQFSFRKRIFTNLIATNGALLEGFMFAIGWRKCSTKNEQFGLYGSLGKIENAKYEWRNRGANLSSVGCILVNYEANIPANQGAFEFDSALTFTMNGFKTSPHLDKDALLYASGWWFQADKWTSQIQRDASKQCTGGKLIFPNEHFWIDLSKCHGLIQVVWASSTFVH